MAWLGVLVLALNEIFKSLRDACEISKFGSARKFEHLFACPVDEGELAKGSMNLVEKKTKKENFYKLKCNLQLKLSA